MKFRMTSPASIFAFCFTLTALLPVTSRAQWLGDGFEKWSGGEPVGWITSNGYDPSRPVVTESPDAHSGSLSARGEVREVFFGTMDTNTVIMEVASYDTVQKIWRRGVPIDFRPVSLRGYFKMNAIGGDEVTMSIQLMKGDQFVGTGASSYSSQSVWRSFESPIFGSQEIPDMAMIRIIVGPKPGSFRKANLGTTVWIDDVTIADQFSAVGHPEESGFEFRALPDAIEIGNGEEAILYRIVDVTGRTRIEGSLRGTARVSTRGLTGGTYFLQLSSGGSLRSHRFQVVR